MRVAGDEVRVEKVSKVVPSTGFGKKKEIFLSSCDLVCRSYPYINRVFFFKCQKAPQEIAAAAQAMKEGLATALVSFYPLSGRLSTNKDGRLQVVCEDDGIAGAEFVEATCELPFSLLAQDGFQYHHVFWKLARRTHYLRCDYLHEPILSVQVTKFKDGGGYSVGVSMSHAVADAQSFYDFVYCWGEVCRGLAMSMPPLHMRNSLSMGVLFPMELSTPEVPSSVVSNGSHDESNITTYGPDSQDEFLTPLPVKEMPHTPVILMAELAKQLEHMDLVNKHTASQTVAQNPCIARMQAPIMEKQMEEEEHRKCRTDLVQKVFSFSLEKLQQLKRRANMQNTCVDASEVFAKLHNDLRHGFTTFEAFCAHWWQCLIRARQLPVTQMVFLLIPINCRQRFLNLPYGYFGNALDGALVKMTVGDLCKGNLNEIATKIHEAIMAVTEDGFMMYIRAVESNRDAIRHFDRRGLFHIVDSPKYPVYDVDFGFGNPQAVRAEGFRFGAEVQIIAGRNGYGSYDLFCALDADVMKRLEQDDAFLACEHQNLANLLHGCKLNCTYLKSK